MLAVMTDCFDGEGLRISGNLLPLSKPLATDTTGRRMPRYWFNHY
ncbi:hypothetical protein SAMN05216404_11717 [Nitrosospira multiformis]|uniref:Uncharacterized protein n=1 Tax=Nitrosospira multiformis TaxID=1231 RepID=A0A1H8NN25_9PROT|nr:hypothetical protein SAMN05216404_11717 [Nitrosospira multiformis]